MWQAAGLLQEMNQLCRFLIITIFFLLKQNLHLHLQFQKTDIQVL